MKQCSFFYLMTRLIPWSWWTTNVHAFLSLSDKWQIAMWQYLDWHSNTWEINTAGDAVLEMSSCDFLYKHHWGLLMICECLEGLSQVMGEIWTTISCKSVLRGIWKQGVGGETGNGIEPLSVPMVWMLVFLASLKCVVASCPHKSEVLDLRKNRCSEDHLERSLHK